MDILIPLLTFLPLGYLVIALCVRTLRPDERHTVMTLMLAGFALRIGAATVFGLVPEARIFHEDASGYEYLGSYLSHAWMGNAPMFEISRKLEVSQNFGFPYVCGAIYYVTGGFRVNVSYVNSILGTVTGFLIYTLARKLLHPKVATLALALIVFTPSMILWSAIAVKEPLVTFLIVVAMIYCLRLKERFSFGATFGIVLSVAAIQPLRFYIVYFLAFAVLGSMVVDRGLDSLTGLYKQIFLAGVGAVLFVLLGVSGGAQQGTEHFDLAYINQFRQGMANTAASGFSNDVDISTPGGVLMFLPIAVPTLLLAPFPWQMTSLRALVAAPETITWWFLFPATLRGLQFMMRRRFTRVSPVLLFSVALTGIYSLMHGNVGSAFRQRAQIFVFLFVFTAVGWYQSKCKKAGIDPEAILLDEGPQEGPGKSPSESVAQAVGGASVAGASSVR